MDLCLPSGGQDLENARRTASEYIISGLQDPSLPGNSVEAKAGTLYLLIPPKQNPTGLTPAVYQKQDNGCTSNWTLLGSGISPSPSSLTQVVYVSKGGSDTSGDGSAASPYLTLKKAIDSISDASAVKKYLVVMGPGDYTESDTLRLKGWVSICSLCTDQVAITLSPASKVKWSNSVPGRLFIKNVAFIHGIEVENDVAPANGGIVLDIDNCDMGPIVFNGRGGGSDYIQLRNDTRIGGTCVINSGATTIFDTTIIGKLTMTDVGCVAPDVYGSAITASLRANYISEIEVIGTSYDVYTDAWANIRISALTMTSSSSYPCNFNSDADSFPSSITLSGSPAPVVNRQTSTDALEYVPAVSGNWAAPAPTYLSEALNRLAAQVALLTGGPIP